MQQLSALLTENADWLAERFLHHAMVHGLSQATPTPLEVWLNMAQGLNRCILEQQANHHPLSSALAPDQTGARSYQGDFIHDAAEKHRSRGVRLPQFLGLLKLLRRSYHDLISERVAPSPLQEKYRPTVDDAFDRLDLLATEQWTAATAGETLAGLQKASLEMQFERDRLLTALESISDPLFLVNGDGTVRYLNLAAATFLRIPIGPGAAHHGDAVDNGPGGGEPPNCLLPRPSVQGAPLGTMLPWLGDEVTDFLRNNRSVARVDKQAVCFGEERHFSIKLSRMIDLSRRFEGLVVILSDVTEQKRMECSLMKSERELMSNRDLMQLIMDGMPALISYVDRDMRYRFANAYYSRIFHVSPDSLIGRTVRDLVGDKVWNIARPRYEAAQNGKAQRFELPFMPPSGGWRHFDVNYIPHVVQGEVQGVIALIIDETERRQAEQERQRFFDISLDLLCVAGMDGYFKKLNAAWSRILGWETTELLASPWLDFVHPDDVKHTIEAGNALNRGDQVIGFENRFRCKDGQYRWLSWNSIPLPSEGLIYGVAHDMTKRRRMEEELMRLATRDSLTGTNNRRQFMELSEAEILRSRRYGRDTSLLMLDIDHFKHINDTLGHPAGDEVLRELVKACLAALRKSDILGRIGGEEFAALLPETDAENAMLTAERIRRDIENLDVRYASHVIRFTISIGIATTAAGEATLDELLKQADDALYDAKRSGRNRVVLS